MKRIGKNVMVLAVSVVVVALLGFCNNADTPSDDIEYLKEIKAWQKKRDTDLKSSSSPLNLIGVYFLKEGINTFGSAQDNDLVLPNGKAVQYAGLYVLNNDTISLQIKDESGIIYNGIKTLTRSDLPSPDEIRSAHNDTTISLEHGSLKWFLFISGGRIAVRVLDSESHYQKNFKGVERYPIDKNWKLEARFEPYDQGKRIEITTIKGNTNLRAAAGLVVFKIGNKEYQLEALDRGSNLFFVFSDETSTQDETYAFRFLSVKKPEKNEELVLDFNKATNPNCAFSQHAPCPLPPAKNKLPVRITAGEKKYSIDLD